MKRHNKSRKKNHHFDISHNDAAVPEIEVKIYTHFQFPLWIIVQGEEEKKCLKED